MGTSVSPWFLAEVALDAGDGVKQTLHYLPYEEVCKVHHR
jgi:hypothetical protein